MIRRSIMLGLAFVAIAFAASSLVNPIVAADSFAPELASEAVERSSIGGSAGSVFQPDFSPSSWILSVVYGNGYFFQP